MVLQRTTVHAVNGTRTLYQENDLAVTLSAHSRLGSNVHPVPRPTASTPDACLSSVPPCPIFTWPSL